MKISKVTNAFKIADVSISKDNPNKMIFSYLNPLLSADGKELPQNILTSNVARVYLIVVDGEIYKIGASNDAGGIKGTLRIYADGGIAGRPSIRSYGVYKLLINEAKAGKRVEFYLIYMENMTLTIKGLFADYSKTNVSISSKILEEACIDDYRKVENGKFPVWNLQEAGTDWSDEIKKEHSDIISKSTDKPGRNKK